MRATKWLLLGFSNLFIPFCSNSRAAVLLGPNCSMPYDYILVCIDRGYAGASDKADIFRSAPRRYVGSARPKEPVGREPTLVRFEVRHEKASDQ